MLLIAKTTKTNVQAVFVKAILVHTFFKVAVLLNEYPNNNADMGMR